MAWARQIAISQTASAVSSRISAFVGKPSGMSLAEFLPLILKIVCRDRLNID
jgi:hypothetical protein